MKIKEWLINLFFNNNNNKKYNSQNRNKLLKQRSQNSLFWILMRIQYLKRTRRSQEQMKKFKKQRHLNKPLLKIQI